MKIYSILMGKKKNPKNQMNYLIGGDRLPQTGLPKTVDIIFSAAIGYPVISTCLLTAKFPLNFRKNDQYVLRGISKAGIRNAASCYSSWVVF